MFLLKLSEFLLPRNWPIFIISILNMLEATSIIVSKGSTPHDLALRTRSGTCRLYNA